MDVKDVQPVNTLYPMVVREGGSSTLLREVQPLNTESEIDVHVVYPLRLMDVKPVFANTAVPRLCRPVGRAMDVKRLHP
jgi:hypothetical protein